MSHETIEQGLTSLGIELGSTRIKAVLIGPDNRPLATGGHDWENQFVDRVWTYSLEEVWDGVRACYASLARDVQDRYGITLERVGAIGVSAMMHGYLAFDAEDRLLVPFRTWRNTTTGEAADELSALFDHSSPQRWSIAHRCGMLWSKRAESSSAASPVVVFRHVRNGTSSRSSASKAR